jgi:hypothetical protein
MAMLNNQMVSLKKTSCSVHFHICSILELEAAIAQVFATCVICLWYLQDVGARTVHVTW